MDIQVTPVATPAAPTGLAAVAAEMPLAAAVEPAVGDPTSPPLTSEALLQTLNDAVGSRSTALEFTVDESTKQQVVVVRDADSGEVIFQCPSQEALRMIRNLKAGVGGLVDRLV